MLATSLVALLDARPQAPHWGRRWIEEIFGTVLSRGSSLGRSREGNAADEGLRQGWPEPRVLCGWSVGTVEGTETLVLSRPVVRAQRTDPVGDFLRRPSTAILGAFASARNPEVALSSASIHMARFHRWLGVRAGAPLHSDQRQRLRSTLPDFLARLPGQNTDTDTVFLRFIAELYATGITGNKYPDPSQVREALERLADVLPEGPANVMVTDGRTLGILHRGGTLLAFDPPPEVQSRRNWLGTGHGSRLMLWHPDSPPEAPIFGAERLGEGVMVAEAMQPARFVRSGGAK